MKILVSGGQGQVGTEFSVIDDPDCDIVCMGSSELNIRDAAAVAAAFDLVKPDVLINAAAYTAVDKAETEQEQAFAINNEANGILASACATADIPMLAISTDYVFNGDKDGPYVESDGPDPQGVYGASKLAGEELLRSTWDKHIILRVSWVFGEYGNNFVKTMLRLAKDRDELGVVADQVGAPTAARCIAANLVSLAKKAHQANTAGKEFDWGTYHLSSEPYVSWHEFAETIFERANKVGLLEKQPLVNAITTADYPTPAKRPANSKMATEKQLPGLTPCDWPSELDRLLLRLAKS